MTDLEGIQLVVSEAVSKAIREIRREEILECVNLASSLIESHRMYCTEPHQTRNIDLAELIRDAILEKLNELKP